MIMNEANYPGGVEELDEVSEVAPPELVGTPWSEAYTNHWKDASRST